MAIPFISLADTFDQWRTKTNINYAAVGDIEGLTTPVTTDVISALNDLNQNLLKDLIDDTTPELGGNLSLNSKDIEGVGNINITGNITGTIVVGGDLSGTVSNAQIVPDAIGNAELAVNAVTALNILDGEITAAKYQDNSISAEKIAPNQISISELFTSGGDGTTGQVLSRNSSGNLEFIDVISDPVMGGDLSGVASAAQIIPNVVGINELNVSDGTSGQLLSRNALGNLEFIDAPAGGGGSGGTAVFVEDLFTGNGSSTTFTLSTEVLDSKTILVSVSGVIQPTSSYTLPTTTSIDFTSSPPANNSAIRVLHLGTTTLVADDSVTNSKLADDSVGTGKIISGSILDNKLNANGTLPAWDGSQLINLPPPANNSVDGTKIALGSDAVGDIMFYNGTDWVRLAKGTAGQTLKMNAGATAPEWAN
jgi:hypothetical protein